VIGSLKSSLFDRFPVNPLLGMKKRKEDIFMQQTLLRVNRCHWALQQAP
jgi:hypothetical protein